MIKTLFFDFGNVIAHFDHWRAVRPLTAFTEMHGDELYATLYDNALEDAYEHGSISTAEYVAEAIRRSRLSISHEDFLLHFQAIFTPNPDVMDAIPKLAGKFRLCLASNTNDAHFTHYCLQFADIMKHFSALPTSHQAGHRKPKPGFFEYCQRFAEAEPGECLFIDDIAINVEAARQHGWHAIQYCKGQKLGEILSWLAAGTMR